MVKLSDRLLCMAECVKPGEAVADIGTDHGLLPIFLYERNESSNLILCDINEGPLKKAEENVSRFLGKELIERGKEQEHAAPFSLRLGDGLTPLKAGEVQAVIIAGMGGILISDILQADIEKARSFSRLILQPRNHSPELRQWLHENRFEIYRELLVREGLYICEVICACPQGDLSPSKPPQSLEHVQLGTDCEPQIPISFEISPLWIRQEEPLLEEFLTRKICVEQKIIDKIEKAQQLEGQEEKARQSGSQQGANLLREEKLRQSRLRLRLFMALQFKLFGEAPKQCEDKQGSKQ